MEILSGKYPSDKFTVNSVKSYLIDLLMSIASLVYKGKRYRPVNGRANLGCGFRCLENWRNVDGSPNALLGSKKSAYLNKILYRLTGTASYYDFAEYDRTLRKNKIDYYDLRNGVPFDDGSLEVIYCSHFLEHLGKDSAIEFLNECCRSLKPGGLIRILVPDLDVAMEMYSAGKVDEMQDLFFYTAPNYGFSAHKYNYNFSTLKGKLESVGFGAVRKLAHGKGDCPDIAYLDVYPDHSLYVEAYKLVN